MTVISFPSPLLSLRSHVLTAALLAGLGGLAGCSTVATAPTAGREASWTPGTIPVKAGARMPLSPVFMSMTTACKSLPRPRLELTSPPGKGKVAFANGIGEGHFGPGDWAHCTGRHGAASVVWYTAYAVPGHDRFTVHVTHHDGSEVWVPFEVEIQP